MTIFLYPKPPVKSHWWFQILNLIGTMLTVRLAIHQHWNVDIFIENSDSQPIDRCPFSLYPTLPIHIHVRLNLGVTSIETYSFGSLASSNWAMSPTSTLQSLAKCP